TTSPLSEMSSESSLPTEEAGVGTSTVTQRAAIAPSATSINTVDISLRSAHALPNATIPARSDVSARIDTLISCLTELKAYAELGKLPSGKLGPVAAAYERFEASLQFASETATAAPDSDSEDDPLPDQLRSGLHYLVRTCVSRKRDCYVAIRSLGLIGDGK